MFALVGSVITRWSFVEESLWRIFAICTSPVHASSEGSLRFFDSQTATEVFYSIESFRGKLNMVDAAVLSQVRHCGDSREGMEDHWAKLKTKTNRLSRKRNKLAHWTVLPAMEDLKRDGRIHEARLVPPIGSPGYYQATGLDRAKATMKPLHIRHMDLAFSLITEKLVGFAFCLARHEALLDRSARLLARRIATLDRIDPNRAEQLRRALSSPE